MAYQKVELGNTWDFEKNAILEGTVVSRKDDVGPNHSTIYRIQLLDSADEVSVWGSTALDSQMENVKDGVRVKIEYKGLAPSPKRAGKTYKNFVVERWIEE